MFDLNKLWYDEKYMDTAYKCRSVGNLGIGIMQWYMKMQISYFAFRYPVKEMIALMVFLLLCSIIFPGIIYKKLKKKRK